MAKRQRIMVCPTPCVGAPNGKMQTPVLVVKAGAKRAKLRNGTCAYAHLCIDLNIDELSRLPVSRSTAKRALELYRRMILSGETNGQRIFQAVYSTIHTELRKGSCSGSGGTVSMQGILKKAISTVKEAPRQLSVALGEK
jgi:hypothetical protein